MPKHLPTLKHFKVAIMMHGLPAPIEELVWAPHEQAAKAAALEKHQGATVEYVLKYFRVQLTEADCEVPIFFDCQADDAEHAKEQAMDAYPGCTVMGLVDEALFVIWAPSAESEEGQCEDGFFNEQDGWGLLPTATLYSGFERDAGMTLMSPKNDHRWLAYEVAQDMVKAHAEANSKVERLRVVLDIAYLADGITPAELKAILEQNLEHAVGGGLLTGDSPAMVDDWQLKITPVSEEAASLDTEEVADWIAGQVESGGMNPEEIPGLLARYALSESIEMREELAERMGK